MGEDCGVWLVMVEVDVVMSEVMRSSGEREVEEASGTNNLLNRER